MSSLHSTIKWQFGTDSFKSPCGSLVWTEYQPLKRKRAEDCTHARWTKVEPEGKKVLSSQSFFLFPLQPLLLFTVYLQNFTFSIVARSSWGKTTAHGLTVRIAWLTPFKKTVTEEEKNQWYVHHHAISAQTKPRGTKYCIKYITFLFLAYKITIRINFWRFIGFNAFCTCHSSGWHRPFPAWTLKKLRSICQEMTLNLYLFGFLPHLNL